MVALCPGKKIGCRGKRKKRDHGRIGNENSTMEQREETTKRKMKQSETRKEVKVLKREMGNNKKLKNEAKRRP